jgi:hypothetical protein
MTSKENLNENLHKPISGIFAKKFMGPHCNALIFGPKWKVKFEMLLFKKKKIY